MIYTNCTNPVPIIKWFQNIFEVLSLVISGYHYYGTYSGKLVTN